jgi:hypothetical protein
MNAQTVGDCIYTVRGVVNFWMIKILCLMQVHMFLKVWHLH